MSAATHLSQTPFPSHATGRGNGLTRHPIDGRGDFLLISRLQAVHHPQHLGSVPARAGGIAQDETDGFLGIDDEHGTDGEGDALLIDVGRILVIQHIVQVRHLPFFVPDDGEAQVRAGDLVDVADPARVRVDRVRAQADQLDAALRELGLQLCKRPQLRRAYRSVVFRVREQNDPFVADELVEIDRAGGGVGFEVGGYGAEAETAMN